MHSVGGWIRIGHLAHHLRLSHLTWLLMLLIMLRLLLCLQDGACMSLLRLVLGLRVLRGLLVVLCVVHDGEWQLRDVDRAWAVKNVDVGFGIRLG